MTGANVLYNFKTLVPLKKYFQNFRSAPSSFLHGSYPRDKWAKATVKLKYKNDWKCLCSLLFLPVMISELFNLRCLIFITTTRTIPAVKFDNSQVCTYKYESFLFPSTIISRSFSESLLRVSLLELQFSCPNDIWAWEWRRLSTVKLNIKDMN